ncbi:MAG: tetratricopeptide repeat protein [Deltaproteobacteria bacterium]|nr:tetratricopeptide repeat protein [Deltaproteobacteria bacterium]
MVDQLIKAISTHNIPLMWMVVIGLLMAFFRYYPKYNHKRYRNNIILLAFFPLVMVTLYFLKPLSLATLFALIPLYAGYFLLTFLAPAKIVFPESFPISRLKTLINDGAYRTTEGRFGKKPFYIHSVPGKMEWDMLQAHHLVLKGRTKEGYAIYEKILNLPLFEEEISNVRQKQVFALLQLGDTNRARSIFEQLSIPKCPEILQLESIFNERKGEFESASQNLLSAIGDCKGGKEEALALIYNNLGRMERILGNFLNAIHYYQKSAEIAQRFKIKSLIHIVFPNIIDVHLLTGGTQEAHSFMERYSGLIDKENVDDLLKFNNYCLEYARQLKNKPLFLENLVRGRTEILPKLSTQEALFFEITELRIRWNNQSGWDEKLFWVRQNLSLFLNLEFSNRYYAIKEIFIILKDLAIMENLGPFEALFGQVIDFMGQSKKEIDRYVLGLPDYCVLERCFWEKEKVHLRKIQKIEMTKIDLMDHYNVIFEHLRSIKDIQLQHGNLFTAIEADLNIVDECMGFILSIGESSLIPYLREVMERHLNDACTDLEKFRHYPASNEYIVRIARYALFLDQQAKAKEYFDDFLRSKISIMHYAAWIQEYYQHLIRIFPVDGH